MLQQKFSFHCLEPLNAVIMNRAYGVQAFLLSNVELLSIAMPPGAKVDGLLAPNTEFHAFQAGQSWEVCALSLT